MRLTRDEFDDRFRKHDLKIALIGMSNIGKSHWARRLKSSCEFSHYEVDDRIQEKLSLSSIARSASWMGQPYEQGYAKKAAEYLKLEAEQTALAKNQTGNVVIDTTGSFIYLDDTIKSEIGSDCLIIYLKARHADLDRLMKQFSTSPKPLIWGDHYEKQDGMSDDESMMALYPSLLAKRDALYSDLADVTIKSRFIRKKSDVFNIIREALPTQL